MWFETVLAIPAGVGIYQIGKSIFRRLFPERKYPGQIDIPMGESIPADNPYRTNAFGSEQVPLLKPSEIIAFAWDQKSAPQCHVCPKCLHFQKKNEKSLPVPKICECPQYSKHHFHFHCFKCDFQAIMRTADDKEKKEKGT